MHTLAKLGSIADSLDGFYELKAIFQKNCYELDSQMLQSLCDKHAIVFTITRWLSNVPTLLELQFIL